MSKRWSKFLILLLAMPLLFVACKKQQSTDAPLTPTYNPSIIINNDNQVLYALDPKTGSKNWQFDLPLIPGSISSIEFQSSPLLYNEMIYIPAHYGFGRDTVYKINSKTGTLVSKIYLSATSYNIQATLIADANLIYIATSNDTLYAVDINTGITKWKFNMHTPIVSSPVIYGTMIYCATTGGIVYALDKTLGPAGLSNWTYTAPGASFYSSPSISVPYLYVGSITDSTMYCVNLKTTTSTSTLKWKYKTGGAIYSSPAANYGICVFGSTDNNVYCLDTATGLARWITPTRSAIVSSPFLANNVAYIGSYDYNLYAINIGDGSVKWSFATTALIKSSPLLYGAYIYVASYDKNLYAVDTSLGTLRWDFNTDGQIECSPTIDDLSGQSQINSQISGYTN